MTHNARTPGARADDVRPHERAQYATPPSLPTPPALPKSSNSPSIQTSSTSTRTPRLDVDGPLTPIQRQAAFELLCLLVAGGAR